MNRLAVAVFLLLGVDTSRAQFTFAPINVPGATQTEARGINNNGEIVGFYKTDSCFDYDIKVPSCPTKGFKLVNGTYIKLMVPNSTATAIMGLNDLGDLVGFYTKSDGSKHGFIWYHTNTLRTIDKPNSQGLTTVPFGINKAGTVAGGLWEVDAGGTFPGGGWVWVNGTFSNMNPFSPNAAGACCQSVNGIANNGVLAGQIFQADFHYAWLKQGPDEDFYLQNNQAIGDTFGTGVNSATDIIGYGQSGWFAKHIELNENNDATEVKPGFITLHYPGMTNTLPPVPLPTYPFALNDARGIVGTYQVNGGLHGFLAKPNF
jgi:uncharacterized membrane protein